jgi:hypothetical protein
MKKVKEYKGILIIVILILGFIFYWFQIRPIQITKKCIESYPYAFGKKSVGYEAGALQKQIVDKAGYDKCLIESGLIRN